MKWDIRFYTQEIEKWIKNLDPEQRRKVYVQLLILRDEGNEIGFPNSRPLGKGLFELHEQRFGLRIYYTFAENHIILLVVAGDKSSQRKDIEKARKRINDFNKREKDGIKKFREFNGRNIK